MHTGLSERAPERDLIAGEDRHAQVFLQGGNDTNSAEAVPAKEHRFGPFRHLRTRKSIQLRGIQLGELS